MRSEITTVSFVIRNATCMLKSSSKFSFVNCWFQIAGIIVQIVATKLIGEKEYYQSVMTDESKS